MGPIYIIQHKVSLTRVSGVSSLLTLQIVEGTAAKKCPHENMEQVFYYSFTPGSGCYRAIAIGGDACGRPLHLSGCVGNSTNNKKNQKNTQTNLK